MSDSVFRTAPAERGLLIISCHSTFKGEQIIYVLVVDYPYGAFSFHIKYLPQGRLQRREDLHPHDESLWRQPHLCQPEPHPGAGTACFVMTEE